MKKIKASESEIFASKYFNPVTGYVGLAAFQKSLPPKLRKKAKKWLEGQDAYTLHRTAPKKFRRQKVAAGFQEQLQADLIDLSSFAKSNNKVRYLLTVIDVFSKVAHVETLRQKDAKSVSSAFEKILDSLSYKPRRLQTDQGKEFINTTFQALLKERNVEFFSTKDADIKCAVVERFNRSLMTRIHRYLTKQNSRKYVDVLSLIVQGYNQTPHSSTGLAPDKVSCDDLRAVWTKLHNKNDITKDKTKTDLRVGTYVRIPKTKKTFKKGYTSSWTGEIFRVRRVSHSSPPSFHLEDLDGEPIDGVFYEKELSITPLPKLFTIETVLDRKGKNILVKWKDYPAKFNQWISSDSVEGA